MKSSPFPDRVILRDPGHRYFHLDTGLEYTSVSKLKRAFEPVFDKQGISRAMAEKQIRESSSGKKYTDADIAVVQKQIIDGWDLNRDESADHGTSIHAILEKFGKTAQHTPGYEEMTKAVYYIFRNHARMYDEVVFYNDEFRVAGTGDKPCFRTSGPKSALDIFDYKTNIKKGIEYYSKYGNYYAKPFSHLEHCNYNDYAIQLSLYALMAELWGFKIGRLAIIFIDAAKLDKPQVIPVNYLRSEAMQLLKSNKFTTQPTNGIVHSMDDEF